jgi:hypothetical protein
LYIYLPYNFNGLLSRHPHKLPTEQAIFNIIHLYAGYCYSAACRNGG